MRVLSGRSLGLTLLLTLVLALESCTGCAHRSRRARERHRERVERQQGRRECNYGSERNSSLKETSRKYSREDILNIAEGDDYDAMLDCQFSKLNDIKSLKEEYFRGDMPDKVVEERMQEIEEKYAPIDNALTAAQNEGMLTYNQHKRQLKLMGDYIKIVSSVCNRLGADISTLIDI